LSNSTSTDNAVTTSTGFTGVTTSPATYIVPKRKSGLSPGVTAGIIVAVVFVFLLVLASLLFAKYRKKYKAIVETERYEAEATETKRMELLASSSHPAELDDARSKIPVEMGDCRDQNVAIISELEGNELPMPKLSS